MASQRHLNHICGEWMLHSNRERSHSSCNHLPPAFESTPEPMKPLPSLDVVCTTRLGGLLKSYSRRAA